MSAEINELKIQEGETPETKPAGEPQKKKKKVPLRLIICIGLVVIFTFGS